MNTIESPPANTEPEQSEPAPQSTLRRWLGKLGLNFKREDGESVSDGNESGGSGTPAKANAEAAETDKAGKIFDAALAEYKEQTKWEAGRTEGRIFPELVVGAQAYPDPRMWGPDTGGVPLTEDEHYGEVARMLDEIDREDGFDGATNP